ncbi:histidine kinase [Fluviicola sp.]|uniref:sensor histidine kinase n=1 Tax=Fluviicola sp. TaxID=1917219 RepID=UPI002602AA2E|nr:histidine kinase [Fluviicola sp.]
MYKSSISLSKEVIIHLIFWLIWMYYSLIGIGDHGFQILDIDLFYTTGILVYIITFYVHYLFVLPRVFKPFKWKKAILGFLISFLFFSSLRYLIEEVLTLYFLNVRNYYPGTSMLYYFYDNLFYSSQPIILCTALWLIIFLVRTLDYNNYIMQEQKNMEIKFLKSQINPHFIFNTLNNIYSMVHFQSPNALSAIEKLSNIMRFTTYEAQKSMIRLSEELNYINAYIELEELRHYEKSFVVWELNVKDEHMEIPPYMLSPFIENALKHGVYSEENPIQISLFCDDKFIRFEVKNRIGQQKKDQLGGIGLQNLKTRLEILYPEKHLLNTRQKEEVFIATLEIRLK